MSRKSKIEPVREYLTKERDKIRVVIAEAVESEDFIRAQYFVGFRVILNVAIQLCGEEKSKMDKIDDETVIERRCDNE